MGWYGQLAARRRAELESSELYFGLPPEETQRITTPPRIPRAGHLDHAVLMFRMKRFDHAKSLLQAILSVGRLRGAERRLLALVYRHLGDDDKADSVLIRRGVLSSVVHPGQTALYGAVFPLRYQRLLKGAATRADIPASLLSALVYVESRFSPDALSGAGAIGLAQLMPTTARSVAKEVYGTKTLSTRRIRRPKVNLTLGATLVAQLSAYFKDHPAPVLSGYNAGRGAARSWLRARGHLPLDAFVETIPYQQTRRYVMRVIALAEVYRRLYRLDESPLTVSMRLPLTVDTRRPTSPSNTGEDGVSSRPE